MNMVSRRKDADDQRLQWLIAFVAFFQDFASLAAQIEGAMSEDDDSDEEMTNNAEPEEASKEASGAPSGSGSGEGGDEGEEEGSEDRTSKAQDLLASLIADAASAANKAPETSSAAAGTEASIDPILESLAASLASTPVVSRAGSPSAGQPPRPGPSPLRNDASTSQAPDAAAIGSRAGPTPTMFVTRTYSTELPKFTESAAELSEKAAGKQPNRTPAASQAPSRPATAAAGGSKPSAAVASAPRPAQQPAKPITNPSAPTGTINATSLNDLQTMPNGEPPNYPWSTIIRAAILGSPYGILSKQEIVKVVLSKWPPFHRRGSQLDAAITYNLRAKVCFLRVRVAGEGKTSFYIVDTVVDASKARPTPYRPRTAAQKRAMPPFTASRYSIAYAYSRNARSGKVPPFLPPQKSAAVATQAAIDQALQAALSELTGQKPPPSAPETPEKVVQPQCRIKGSQVVTRMRYANGATSEDDPDPSEEDASTSESEEEEDDDEQPEDIEAIRAAESARGGPRLGSSLTALIGGSSSAPLPTRRGLGSSLANIGGPSAASSRWAHRTAGARADAAAKKAAPAGGKTTSLDAQIAAALASVGAQLNDDSSDDDDDDDEAPEAEATSAAPAMGAFGLDLAAMNKEIEAALASSSDSDDEEEEGEDVEMGEVPLDFDTLLAQATGQNGSASPAPADSTIAATTEATTAAPASKGVPADSMQALLSILQPGATAGTKRTADEADLDGDSTVSTSAAPLPPGIVKALHDLLKKAPTEPGQPASEGQDSAASGPSPDAALNAAIAQALAAQKQTAPPSTSAATKSVPAKAPVEPAQPARKVGAAPIISTYIPKRGGAQSAAAQRAASKQASSSQNAGTSASSPGGSADAPPQTVTAPNGEVFEKPKATYPELAKEAINSHPDRRMTAADVFQIIEEKHPYVV